MKAHYAPAPDISSDRSPRLVIPHEGSVYSMQEQSKHVPNMAPSTVLTPPDWRHVMIHPDAGGRFKLTGYASAMVWSPADLRALGVHVKSGKVWGLTKDRAVEIGGQIEAAMKSAAAGNPLPKSAKEPPPAENRSLGQKPIKPPTDAAQASLL